MVIIYNYIRGDDISPIMLEQDDGTPIDLSEVSAMLLVSINEVTHYLLPLVTFDAILGITYPDVTALAALPEGTYSARLRLVWEGGTYRDTSQPLLTMRIENDPLPEGVEV